MKIKVNKVNAFTDSTRGGNPAGVVLDPPVLSDMQMKQVTKKLNVSESAFVYPSDVADYKLRFFSPVVEVELCGHATIATFYTMASEGVFTRDVVVNQETKAGVLPVNIFFKDGVVDKVMMTQGRPIYKNVYFDISNIADSLNISTSDIDDNFPKQIVSTGLFTLPVYIKSFDVLKNIKPDFEKIKTLCKQIGAGSLHLYTFETLEPSSTYHARNFCPLYGINEDSVTGTANGAVCSYLYKNGFIKEKNMICEQGDILGRSGRVLVEVDSDIVRVGGRAQLAEKKEIEV